MSHDCGCHFDFFLCDNPGNKLSITVVPQNDRIQHLNELQVSHSHRKKKSFMFINGHSTDFPELFFPHLESGWKLSCSEQMMDLIANDYAIVLQYSKFCIHDVLILSFNNLKTEQKFSIIQLYTVLRSLNYTVL